MPDRCLSLILLAAFILAGCDLEGPERRTERLVGEARPEEAARTLQQSYESGEITGEQAITRLQYVWSHLMMEPANQDLGRRFRKAAEPLAVSLLRDDKAWSRSAFFIQGSTSPAVLEVGREWIGLESPDRVKLGLRLLAPSTEDIDRRRMKELAESSPHKDVRRVAREALARRRP